MKLRCTLLLLFSMSLVSAGSVGISPASFTEHFEPGMERTFTFKAFGSNDGMRVYLGGELREYANLSQDYFEGEGTFQVTLKLPNSLSHPGINTLYVGVIESQKEGDFTNGLLGGVAAIQAPVRIIVPYPGQYLEARFRVKNLNEGEKALYFLDADNLGTDDLILSSRIQIYHGADLETLLLERIINATAIETRSSKNWNGFLETEALPPGDYAAYATLTYGSEELVLNSSFSIGKQFIEIINFDHLFGTGEISPMHISIRSKWNSVMEQVHAEIVVTQNGKVVDTIRTPSTKVDPWTTQNLTGFLDARNLTAGRYLANILVHYGEGKTSNKLVAVYLNDPPVEVDRTKEIIIAASSVFAIGFIWLVYLLIRVWRLKRAARKK